MLIKVNGEAAWVDVAALETTDDLSTDEAGHGTITQYRGEPGFVCLRQDDGHLVLVNARHVTALRAEGGATEVETARGLRLIVEDTPEKVAGLINQAARQVV